jgi:starvation-inducible DNA-binding protein
MASVTADLEAPGGAEISDALRHLLADVFTVVMKTKGLHWHIGGRHFRDYHLLLDEQASQIFAMVDEIAERARKLGGATLRSVSEITRNQRLRDNDDGRLSPADMLKELLDDNRQLIRSCAAPTSSAIGTATLPRPACSRTGSTKPSGESGSSRK